MKPFWTVKVASSEGDLGALTTCTRHTNAQNPIVVCDIVTLTLCAVLNTVTNNASSAFAVTDGSYENNFRIGAKEQQWIQC